MHATFIGAQSSEVVRKGAEVMLALIAEKKYHKYLNDNTRLIGGKEINSNWIPDVFVPKAMAAGIRNLAYVLPPRAQNTKSFTELDLNLPPELEIMFFDDLEDARHWLIST